MGLHVCKLFYLVKMDVYGFTWKKECPRCRGYDILYCHYLIILLFCTTSADMYKVNNMASGRRPEHQAPPEVVSFMRLCRWNCNVWFLSIQVMPEIVWLTYFSVLQRRWSSEIHFKVSGFFNVYNVMVTRVLSRSMQL